MTSEQNQVAHSELPYRPDIDGLRALAITLVLIFHSFPETLRGGFIGVDIFFAISGYLITGILISSFKDGTFSFKSFYSRRIRRIFPSLIVVLLSTYATGYLLLFPIELKQLSKHIIGGSAFFSNFLLHSEIGYFDPAAENKPLLHLWSLSIEEQFYIALPVLLWVAYRQKFNLLTILICLAVSSFYLNLITTKSLPSNAFYSPLTRAWEFLSGSILAWASVYNPPWYQKIRMYLDKVAAKILYSEENTESGRTLSNSCATAGLALICFSAIHVDKGFTFPGKWAILPVIGACLLIFAGPGAWINRVLLSNKPTVFLGRISYPLYLWHWPLLSFAYIIHSEHPSPVVRAGLIALSAVLAYLTFALIETPLKKLNNESAKAFGLLALMSMLGLLGFATYSSNGITSYNKSIHKVTSAIGEWEFPGKLAPFIFDGRTFYRQSTAALETTIFIGDSNMEQYYPRIDEIIRKNPNRTNSVIFATRGGCLPIPLAPYSLEYRYCEGMTETVLKYIANTPQIDTVVISAQWNGYLGHGDALNGEFGHGTTAYKSALAQLDKYLTNLKQLDKTVYFITNIPISSEIDPRQMVKRNILNFPNVFSYQLGGVSRKQLDKKYDLIQKDISSIAQRTGAIVIHPMDDLCNKDICPNSDEDGNPLYKDLAHLRPSYARQKATFIDRVVATD
jgi:peptidoglycan/LPS O-acetylase OafA/YrhL